MAPTKAELRGRIAELESERDHALGLLRAAQVDAIAWRARALDERPRDAPDAQVAFMAQRVAYHLAHGCDTAERARELALAEWDVGVMGVRR